MNRRNTFLTVTVTFFFFAAPAFAADAPAKGVVPKSVAVDTNKDGKPDRWESYENGQLSKIEIDGNYDGNIDEWVMAADGKPSKLEKDTDFDGKVDQWVTY